MSRLYSELGFPKGTAVAQEWTTIIRQEEPLPLPERTSSRMVKIAANLPGGEWIGWQAVIPTDGTAGFSSFGSKSIKQSDLEWIAEETADVSAVDDVTIVTEPADIYAAWRLYDVLLPVAAGAEAVTIGFTGSGDSVEPDPPGSLQLGYYRWPQRFSDQFGELVEALRIEGAALRFTAGSATVEEQKACIRRVERTWTPGGNDISSYIGYPVRTRLLLALPYEPTARIRAIVDVCAPGAKLSDIGAMSEKKAMAAWREPLAEAAVLPDYAARIMTFEPTVGLEPVIGVEARDPEAKLLPARHKDEVMGLPVTIGRALDISGIERPIVIGDEDLRRHWQIIGQTGTGKSTLLAAVILDAVKKGLGVTFFDPHGTTIDILLRTLPGEFAGRVRVVRIGDTDNPVPVNMWETEDPSKAERTIADMCLLFQEIFDPKHEGFVGPRWERMFSLLAKTSIAVFGKRASLESIVTIARDKKHIRSAITIIREKHRSLANALTAEWLNNNSNDFAEAISWFVAKFQRLTSVEQLRNTLGAGANALDFDLTIDTDVVTLVDLALPVIGTHASRIIGTMLLQQLWAGALVRNHRDKTHVTVLDETQLFQTNPLPQMLAEGRKFGVALLLAHQHNGQLTYDVREALSANSANFSAFCLSVKDAIHVIDRFDDPQIQRDLSRQNTFNATTTINLSGKQSPAFTLKIERLEEQPDADEVAALIASGSIRELVDPYRSEKPLSEEEIIELLSARADAVEESKRAARRASDSSDRDASAPSRRDFAEPAAASAAASETEAAEATPASAAYTYEDDFTLDGDEEPDAR